MDYFNTKSVRKEKCKRIYRKKRFLAIDFLPIEIDGSMDGTAGRMDGWMDRLMDGF